MGIEVIEHERAVCFTSRPRNQFITYFDFEIYINKRCEKNWKEVIQEIVKILRNLEISFDTLFDTEL